MILTGIPYLGISQLQTSEIKQSANNNIWKLKRRLHRFHFRSSDTSTTKRFLKTVFGQNLFKGPNDST